LLGPWTYLNLNHLNSALLWLDLQPNIRERNPIVKQNPAILVLTLWRSFYIYIPAEFQGMRCHTYYHDGWQASQVHKPPNHPQWNRVRLETLTILKVVEQFPEFCWTSGSLQCSEEPVACSYPQPCECSLWSILILSYRLGIWLLDLVTQKICGAEYKS